MKLEHILLNEKVNNWKVEQLIVFDWDDGPREGVCLLRNPKGCFLFKAIATIGITDDLNECLYCISEIDMSNFVRLLEILSKLGKATHQTWIPIWRFCSEKDKAEVEDKVSEIVSQGTPVNVIVQSNDMMNITSCWEVVGYDKSRQEWREFVRSSIK